MKKSVLLFVIKNDPQVESLAKKSKIYKLVVNIRFSRGGGDFALVV